MGRKGRDASSPALCRTVCISTGPQTGTTIVPLDGATRVHRRGVPRRHRHLFLRSPPTVAVAQVAALREERRGENEKWGLGLGADGSAGFDLAKTVPSHWMQMNGSGFTGPNPTQAREVKSRHRPRLRPGRGGARARAELWLRRRGLCALLAGPRVLLLLAGSRATNSEPGQIRCKEPFE